MWTACRTYRSPSKGCFEFAVGRGGTGEFPAGGPQGEAAGWGGVQRLGGLSKLPPARASGFARWAPGARDLSGPGYGILWWGHLGGASGIPQGASSALYRAYFAESVFQEGPDATLAPLQLKGLCDDNWATWARSMEEWLVDEELVHTIQSDRYGEVEDSKAYSCLVAGLSTESQSIVDYNAYGSAYRLWHYIIETCTKGAKWKINESEVQLIQLSKKGDEDLSAYVGRARALATSIRKLGGQYCNIRLCVDILSGLRDEHGSVISELEWMIGDEDSDVDKLEAA